MKRYVASREADAVKRTFTLFSFWVMKKYLAECIGTFSFIFCGTGAVTVHEVMHGSVIHTGIAITFGLIVMAMIYALGDVSGAHFNPAVALAFAINRNFAWKQVTPYIISQGTGAFAASLILKFLFPASDFLGSTLPAGTAMQ